MCGLFWITTQAGVPRCRLSTPLHLQAMNAPSRILALRELEVPPSFRPLRVKTCSCSELVENSLPRPHLAGRYLAANFDVTQADVPRKPSECLTSETPFPSHVPCSHIGRMLSTHVLSFVIAGSTTGTTCSRTTTSRSVTLVQDALTATHLSVFTRARRNRASSPRPSRPA